MRCLYGFKRGCGFVLRGDVGGVGQGLGMTVLHFENAEIEDTMDIRQAWVVTCAWFSWFGVRARCSCTGLGVFLPRPSLATLI